MYDPILIAKGEKEVRIRPDMSNKHGLIAGATGTGKTVTLQVLAENFSNIGVPVFLADVKGDLSGVSQPGKTNDAIDKRLKKIGVDDYIFEGSPVIFWDIFKEKGHPVRTTVSEIGPILLSRLLNLNDTQSATLTLVFKAADDNGLLLLDLKDLRAMLQYVGENHKQFSLEYGRVSTASIGAIQRSLLMLEEEEGHLLFGEPAFNLDDIMQTDSDGKGFINILHSDRLIRYPKLYSTFLLWVLSELFETLPEVGDPEKPKLVFFFDEAHLLFEDTPRILRDKIEQVVRLIRSKGVGIFFVTQHPLDIPDEVSSQLGNRVQHALRAYTPKEQKAVKTAAETFRTNPKLDVVEVITELGVGEALVSFLEEKGVPGIVERALILPPKSQIGPINSRQRSEIIDDSIIHGYYEKEIDRESAYELLKGKADEAAKKAEVLEEKKEKKRGRPRDTIVESVLKSTARSFGSQIGRTIARGVLGSIFGRKR